MNNTSTCGPHTWVYYGTDEETGHLKFYCRHCLVFDIKEEIFPFR